MSEDLPQPDEMHRAGITIVMVTHEPDVAWRAERIVVMRDGRVSQDRPVTRPEGPARSDRPAEEAGSA